MTGRILVLLAGCTVLVLVIFARLVSDILKALVLKEVQGALAERLEGRVRDAVNSLPPDLAREYEREWLIELQAAEASRPLKAILLVAGLPKAAREIAAESSLTPAITDGLKAIPSMTTIARRRTRRVRTALSWTVVIVVAGTADLGLAIGLPWALDKWPLTTRYILIYGLLAIAIGAGLVHALRHPDR